MKAILNTLAKQIRGVSYKPENVLSSSTGNGVPLLRANNIRNNLVNFDELVFIDKKCVKEDQYLQKGDILVCTSSGSRMLVGKSAYIDKNYPYVFGAFCRVIRPQHVNHKFLAYYFQSPSYYHQISQFIAGANINNIRSSDIDQMIIDVPDISQQEKIVVKFDKIFKLISLRHKQLMLYDELIKSRFIEMFGDSQSNPKGFPYKRINEFAKCIAGATPSTKRKEYWSNGIIPWMSSGEVNYKRIWETEKRISQIGYDSCSTKMIPAHTVVIAMAGQGRTRGTVAVAEIPLCTNQSLCSIITDKTVDTDYLFTYLQLQYDNLRNISNGSAGRGGLNIKLIGQFSVLVPPLAVQQKFSNYLREIDKSRLAVQKSLDKLEILKKSLMQQYFG